MHKTISNKIVLAIVFVFFLIAYQMILRVIPPDYNDMHDHAAFARQMCTGEIPYAGNFLVYLLVNIFSFFTANVTFTEISLCFLLAFAGTYRYYLSLNKIQEVLFVISDIGQQSSVTTHHSPLITYHSTFTNQLQTALLALCMLFVFAIPLPSYLSDDRYFYIGNYVPNVWHNSTILFLFPFAILLFDLSYKQLQLFDVKRNWWILGLITLNLFIKPSYFFVFLCVYPLMLLLKYKFKKEFWLSIIPLVVGFVLLMVEYIIIYKTAKPTGKEASSVIFLPFYRSPEFDELYLIPVAMIFSMFFPLLYSIFNFKKVIKNQIFWYTFLSFLVSVLIFLFISETGPRASHGNFYWQIVITTWFCFFVSLLALLKDFNIEGKTFKNKLLFSLFGIHVLMGVIYFVRILMTGSYY